jgi:hypothetical protein
MHYSDYLREQAAKYRQLAEAAEDTFVKQEFLELAAVCEEVANRSTTAARQWIIVIMEQRWAVCLPNDIRREACRAESLIRVLSPSAGFDHVSDRDRWQPRRPQCSYGCTLMAVRGLPSRLKEVPDFRRRALLQFVLFRCDPSLLHLPHTTAMCSTPLRQLASVAPHSDLRDNDGAQLSLDVREGALGLLALYGPMRSTAPVVAFRALWRPLKPRAVIRL